MHFLPKDVETDDLCRSPQTPSSQLERGCVSIYFRVSPCPLFKIQTLCVQAAAVFVVVDAADFFFLNLPRLATSEKQTLYLAEDNIWRCPREGTRIDTGELRGNFKRRPLGLLAFILAPSWAP